MARLKASFVSSDTVAFRLEDRIYLRSSHSWPKLCSFRRPTRSSWPIRLPPLRRPSPATSPRVPLRQRSASLQRLHQALTVRTRQQEVVHDASSSLISFARTVEVARIEPCAKCPQGAVIREQGTPGEADRRTQELAALVEHALFDDLGRPARAETVECLAQAPWR